MRQGIRFNESKFPSPWEYFEVPPADAEELLGLYVNLYLKPSNPTLPQALQRVLYPDEWVRSNPQYMMMASPEAHEAAKFFIIADFIGMKYERFHPTFVMKPVPDEVLMYLKPPYNKMKLLGYEDQKRFRAALPDAQKCEVFIDE